MTVDDSYAWCTEVARTQAKNFYYSFLLLPAPRRRAMCAIYSFMRYCDDLSDDEGIGRSRRPPSRVGVRTWKTHWLDALPGTRYGRRLSILSSGIESHHEYFFEMIEGVSSDLEPRRNQNL